MKVWGSDFKSYEKETKGDFYGSDILQIKQFEELIKRSYLDEPLLISFAKKNRLKIPSDFLYWQQCTIMMWVLVPPRGQGLRDSPSNRYLLAHHTGKTNSENHTYFNHFSLEHSAGRVWRVRFSNDKAEYPNPPLLIQDGLDPGWHQFLIAWDRSEPKIVFLIDAGRSGNDYLTSFSKNWPERLADNLTVGTWVIDMECHNSEAKLFKLSIFDRFLESTDSAVKTHFLLRPR